MFILQVSVRFEPFDAILSEGLEVLRVVPNTPADRLQLKSQRDWIVATSDGAPLRTSQSLAKLLEESYSTNIPLGLLIYNQTEGIVREIFAVPTPSQVSLRPLFGAEVSNLPQPRSSFPTPIPSPLTRPHHRPETDEAVQLDQIGNLDVMRGADSVGITGDLLFDQEIDLS